MLDRNVKLNLTISWMRSKNNLGLKMSIIMKPSSADSWTPTMQSCKARVWATTSSKTSTEFCSYRSKPVTSFTKMPS